MVKKRKSLNSFKRFVLAVSILVMLTTLVTIVINVYEVSENENEKVSSNIKNEEIYGPPAMTIEDQKPEETVSEVEITEIVTTNATVVKTTVNVRLSPSTSDDQNILCRVAPGTRIKVYPEIFVDECYNSFVRVEIPNSEVTIYKYIAKDYIICDDESTEIEG